MKKIESNRFTASSVVLSSQHLRRAIALPLTVSFVLIFGILYPASTEAGILDEVKGLWQSRAEAASTPSTKSVQTMPLLKPAMNIDPNPAKGGGDVVIVDGQALVPEEGPAGTMADIVKPKSSDISLYVVREGDTLSGIANMFEVTVNTIKWANDIPARGTIRPGQTLTILPVPGVRHTVKKGDTLASVAKQYHGDATEIANFNGIEGALVVGAEIMIPSGEITAPAAPAKKAVATVRTGGSSTILAAAGYSTSPEYSGYYIAPLANYKETQGVHGYNGVDLASLDGKNAAILAAAAGEVIVAREGGYNGGYGSYVVIKHDNGTQTLYAHQSSVIVGIGDRVVQGQIIGYQGMTGKATGAHVHFEIRGGPRNPF